MSLTSSRLLPVALLAIFMAGGVAPVRADDPPRPSRSEQAPSRQPVHQARGQQDLSDSVRRYGRENRGGRVLSAERMQSDGRDLNRIKMVDDRGRVRVYVDDPRQSERSARPAPQRPSPSNDD